MCLKFLTLKSPLWFEYIQIYPNGTPRMMIYNDEKKPSGLIAFPNPFDGTTTLRINVPDELTNAYVIIRDITGKQIAQARVVSNNADVILNLEEYGNGIYFATLYNSGNNLKTVKLIKF